MAAKVPLPTPAQLTPLGAGYKEGTIDQKRQRCLLLLAKIWQLKGQSNQADYTANFSQLVIDATTAAGWIPDPDLLAVRIGLEWNTAGNTAGAPATLAARIVAVGGLINLTDPVLARVEFLLEYLLQKSAGA